MSSPGRPTARQTRGHLPPTPGAGGEGTAKTRSRSVDSRLSVARWLAVAMLGVLVGRLYDIQFAQGDALRTQADANRFVPRETEADRGVIYDSAGRQVVLNKPRFIVRLLPAALPKEKAELQRVLGQVGQALDMPVHQDVVPQRGIPQAARSLEAAAKIQSERRAISDYLPYTRDGTLIRTWQPIPIARNVPRQSAFELMESAWELPGVSVEEAPVREYPAGPTLSHLLGFTGSIPVDELADYSRRGYAIYDIVGRSGLEATYEMDLKGEKGEKIVEIDATGRELRVVGEPEAPTSGSSLVLGLDLEFQKAVEDILAEALARTGTRSAAVAVLDPRNGAVRALVSWPTFDNNMFSTGASPSEFTALLENPNRPLLNRAVSGLYPPGSTFKMITASAALQEGIVSPSSQISCPGVIVLTNQYDPGTTYPFVCWNRGGHGAVNVVGALAQSCDIFFYEVAGGYHEHGANQAGLGSELLGSYAEMFGLGEPTGIELLGETGGRVPSPDWLEETSGMIWTTGNTYHMGIGQSDLLVTPLQMASVTAAVANGGTVLKPRLVDRVIAPDGVESSRTGQVKGRLAVDPGNLALVREGMRLAVTGGTARSAWSQLPDQVAIAGKTGTAEFCDPVFVDGEPVDCRRDREGNLLTHAWFVAFAPYENPEIALAVFVDGSGLDHIIEGSQVAAPIAAAVIRAYFGIPDPQPAATPTSATGDDVVPGEAPEFGEANP